MCKWSCQTRLLIDRNTFSISGKDDVHVDEKLAFFVARCGKAGLLFFILVVQIHKIKSRYLVIAGRVKKNTKRKQELLKPMIFSVLDFLATNELTNCLPNFLFAYSELLKGEAIEFWTCFLQLPHENFSRPTASNQFVALGR